VTKTQTGDIHETPTLAEKELLHNLRAQSQCPLANCFAAIELLQVSTTTSTMQCECTIYDITVTPTIRIRVHKLSLAMC